MSEHILFNQKIVFSDSEDRFCKLQTDANNAIENATDEFKEWYSNCNQISKALNEYRSEALELVKKYAVSFLFQEFAQYEIYNISIEAYSKKCIDLSDVEEAYRKIAVIFEDINRQNELEHAYREARKAGRNYVVGGGFGVGGALKGMATAKVLNGASGMGHSIANSIGNARSNRAAASKKNSLYNSDETFKVLSGGLQDAILFTFNEHKNILNGYKQGFIKSNYSSDESSALFENAKKIPDKSIELLIEAFKKSPWNESLYAYIFENYPDERISLQKVAKYYNIDFDSLVEKQLSSMYSEDIQASENDSINLRKIIVEEMAKYGIEESGILYALDVDCAKRIADEYLGSKSEERTKIAQKLHSFAMTDEIKTAAIKAAGFWEIAEYYNVTFSPEEIENILSNEYSKIDSDDENSFHIVKERMSKLMKKYSVAESFSYDKLEQGYLDGIVAKYNMLDDSSVEEFNQELQNCDILDRNKAEIIRKYKIWQIACQYKVQLSDSDIEAILQREYTEEAKNSDEKALEAKRKITFIMGKLNVTESKTFDRLERDCLNRLCHGLVEATEEYCNELMERIDSFEALEKNKEPFKVKVKKRIEDIWSNEEDSIFADVFIKTDLLNQESISKSIQFIESKSRTEASQKYIDVLKSCNLKSVKSAKSAYGFIGKIWLCFAILFAVGAAFSGSDAIYILPFAIICLIIRYSMIKNWKKLTFDGTVINPIFEKHVPKKYKEQQK